MTVGGTMIDGKDVQSCTFNHQILPRSRYFNMALRVIFLNAPPSGFHYFRSAPHFRQSFLVDGLDRSELLMLPKAILGACRLSH